MAGSSKFVAVNVVNEDGSLRAPSHAQILGFMSCHSDAHMGGRGGHPMILEKALQRGCSQS